MKSSGNFGEENVDVKCSETAMPFVYAHPTFFNRSDTTAAIHFCH